MLERRGSQLLRRLTFCAAILCGSVAWCAGKSAPAPLPANSGPETTHVLEDQVKQLQSSMAQMQSQMDLVQSETEKLKSELQDARDRLAALQSHAQPEGAVASGASGDSHEAAQSQVGVESHPSASSVKDRLAQIENQQQLLKSKVSDQYQTKVESASKYRVVLSGIALLNVFSNRGNVDNQDVPGLAEGRGPLDTNAVFGATVRQSMIGLDVFGPTFAGARTHGEIQTDFFGGFPSTLDGVSAGVMRIRTATIHMDWHDTSLVAGQDTLFFSPLSPTSFASLAEPALAYSGNLWTWVPQIRVEHHFNLSGKSGLLLQGGILDSLTGEPTDSFYRGAQAGEKSGQPAYATRLAWTGSAFGRPVTVGVGGYYSPQNWGFGRKVNGWAETADWDTPIGRWFSLSGEFYRGRAIGGLGGGIGRSVLYNGPLTDPATAVLGLNTVGGWAQLKFRPTERLEFNGAFGEDDPSAADLRRFPGARSYFDATTDRNQSGFVNFIYHPRSNLVLSLEYRRLWTSDVDEAPYRAGQINLGIGVLF